jgi:hypothetical protein
MAKDRTSDAAVDQGHTPAWVTEKPKKVPVCCRCGREVPNGRTLYVLCEECRGEDLKELKLTAPFERPPGGAPQLIGQLAKQLVDAMPERGPRGEALSSAVVQHRERLQARGLDVHTALRQAEAMVADPAHRAGCAICEGNLLPPRRVRP